MNETYQTQLVFTADAEIEVGTFDEKNDALVNERNEIFHEGAVVDVEVVGDDEDVYVVLFASGEAANLPKDVVGSAPVVLEQREETAELEKNSTPPNLSPVVVAALGSERELTLKQYRLVNGDTRLLFSARLPDGFTDEDVIGAAMDAGVIDPDDAVTVEQSSSVG